MSKEYLEFFGGLFVFLAALVPVVRSLWRALRRKFDLRPLLILLLMTLNLGVFLVGMIGSNLKWNPGLEAFLFLVYVMVQGTFFLLDKSALTRTDVGIFILCMVSATLFLSLQIQRLELQDHLKTINDQVSPTPTPSPTPSPNPT